MQILKEEIKERILKAALMRFAEKGFQNTTMVDIARTAGSSVGNLYLYYKNKTDLFNSIISAEFITEFKALLFRKIKSADGIHLADIRQNPSYLLAGEEIITFFCKNRLQVVIILENAEGTPYSGIKDEIIGYLTDLFCHYLKSVGYDIEPVEMENILLLARIIYSNLIKSILDVLKIDSTKEQLRLNLLKLLDYHMFGLNGLIR